MFEHRKAAFICSSDHSKFNQKKIFLEIKKKKNYFIYPKYQNQNKKFHEVNQGKKIRKCRLKFKQLFPYQTFQRLGKFFFQNYIYCENATKQNAQPKVYNFKKCQKGQKKNFLDVFFLPTLSFYTKVPVFECINCLSVFSFFFQIKLSLSLSLSLSFPPFQTPLFLC